MLLGKMITHSDNVIYASWKDDHTFRQCNIYASWKDDHTFRQCNIYFLEGWLHIQTM